MKHLPLEYTLLGLGVLCLSCAKPQVASSPSQSIDIKPVTASVGQDPVANAKVEKFKLLNEQIQTKIKSGDDKAAETLLKQGIEMEPGFRTHRAQLAEIYIRQGRNKEAIQQYRKIFEYTPLSNSSIQTDPVVLTAYGELCLKEGLREEAKAAFLKAIDTRKYETRGPDLPKVYLVGSNFNDIYASANLVTAFRLDPPKNGELMRKVISLKPDWEGARFYFAYFAQHGGPKQSDEALEIFKSLRNSSDPLIRKISIERAEALITWRKQGRKPGPGASVTAPGGPM